MSESRVPTSEGPKQSGWSLETAIDYLLSLINEKHEQGSEMHQQTLILIEGNDKRYEERFLASQKALDLGFSAAKAAVDAAFAAQEKGISAALAAADRAVNKAELASEKRFEGVNEFRNTLSDQQRTLIPRSEVDVLIRGLEEKIANNAKLLDEIRNRDRVVDSAHKGLREGWGIAVGVAGFVLAVVTIIWRLSTP